MRIINISLGKNILDRNSKTFQRQKEYAGLVDKYYVVIFGPKKEIQEDNLFVYGSGGGNKVSRFFKAYKKAKEILKGKDLKDWLVTTQDPFFSGFLGYLLKRKFSIKLHVQLHGDFFSSKYFRKESLYARFLYFLGKFIIKKADSFRVVSQRIKESLIKLGVDEDKITVVPIYAQKAQRTIEEPQKDTKRFVFLTIGRLVLVKNIGLQIKALAEVIKKYPDVELWVAGEGKEKKKLELLTKKLGLEKRVKFWGWQDNLEKFYKQADVLLLTSNYEGWGLTVIEAASFGLPIIMTDVGCAGEVIKNGKSGLVVPIGDQEALERAMVKLVEDEELKEKLGKNARQSASRLPDKEETLNLYKKSQSLCL